MYMYLGSTILLSKETVYVGLIREKSTTKKHYLPRQADILKMSIPSKWLKDDIVIIESSISPSLLEGLVDNDVVPSLSCSL